MINSYRKDNLFLPVIIFLSSLLIRLFFLVEIIHHPLFIPISTGLDPALYHKLAHQILNGNFYKIYHGTLLYPLILAGIYSISNVFGAKLIQIVLGSISCVLIFLITKNIFNKKSALIASLISIFYPVSIIHESILIYTSYVIFFNLLTIFLLISKKLTFKKAFFCGLSIGISFLLSPQNIFFILGIFIWLLIFRKKDLGIHNLNLSKYIIVFSLGLILIITPFMLRNLISGKYLSPTTPYAGIAFYLGNNPYAGGIFNPIPGIRYSIKGQPQDFKILAETNSVSKLTSTQVSLFWIRKSLDFIKNNPLRYLKLEFMKILLFLNREEFPDLIQNQDYFRNYSILIKILSLISFGIIGPFSLMGVIVSLKKNSGTKLLFIYIISYLLILMVFYVTSRYRLPAVYGFFPFAGFYINWLYEKISNHKFRILIYNSIGLMLCCFILNINLDISKPVRLSHYNKGVIYVAQGKLDKALDEYKKVLEVTPQDVNTHFGLGEIYYRQEKYEKAAEEFKKCLNLNPAFLDAYYNLGLTLFKLDKFNEAIRYLNKLLKLDFKDAEVHFLLARLYLRIGECVKALNEFKTTLSLNHSLKTLVEEEIKSNNIEKCRKYFDVKELIQF